MRIAIHHREGSFSDRWIAYCERRGISYKKVDAYASDIVNQVADCDAFMWHHHHALSKDVQFAKQLLFALQQAGKVVFPDFNIGWHFDDKVGQKYLFEALGLACAHSYVFYSKEDALAWSEKTTYPKVFKLKGGAGSSNVRLVKDLSSARRLINQAFGRGFRPIDRWGVFHDSLKKHKWRAALKNLLGVLFPGLMEERLMSRHKGYIYFQDFIPGMTFDIRVIVVGEKAFSIKRVCREKDFRASGSGKIIYSKEEQNEECVLFAFDVAERMCRPLDASAIGFDFVLGKDKRPLLIEMSYGFDVHGYDLCPGFWTKDGVWHEGPFLPQEWMVDCVVGMVKNAFVERDRILEKF